MNILNESQVPHFLLFLAMASKIRDIDRLFPKGRREVIPWEAESVKQKEIAVKFSILEKEHKMNFPHTSGQIPMNANLLQGKEVSKALSTKEKEISLISSCSFQVRSTIICTNKNPLPYMISSSYR